MNRKLIIKVLGALLLIEAAAMIPSFIVSLIYRDGDTKAIGFSFLLISCAGASMCFLLKTNRDAHLRLKEGFIITAIGWIMLGACGALPFLFSGAFSRFEDAFFEAVMTAYVTSKEAAREKFGQKKLN